MSTDIHNFDDSLARSHAAENWSGWERIYRKAFPNFQTMASHRQDGWWQRHGIDRSIILTNSKVIKVDEKVRGKNARTGKVYDDIALEWWSDERQKIPGWVCKGLMADYIAYAILPLGRCYLLPVIQLQAAWKKHKGEWFGIYPVRRSPNEGWTTVFLCVPVDVVLSAIGECLRVEFEPVDLVDGTLPVRR
jgi:hypothetical protein